MATGGNRVSTYRYAVGSLIVAACAWAGCTAQNAQPVAAGPATMPAPATALRWLWRLRRLQRAGVMAAE